MRVYIVIKEVEHELSDVVAVCSDRTSAYNQIRKDIIYDDWSRRGWFKWITNYCVVSLYWDTYNKDWEYELSYIIREMEVL